ncbi:PREDICTED: photosynthetic NDH subunit of subcomplex B 3, chloroplastic [Nelumbo nucifera]|uniref:Photosynthetic NDH subunit of subcomplex B 3, chloroplastic n=2 Tax=Nelumbo nucifera TaxID=4432 RepID=A0A1U7ZNF8_NELNU|nr:PREDICTED: photosynthetic NDH subunit of subcomplex B 3, chloroplastic [Nelumbo nucifera]DAD35605.1 TPA_asm: hypothetical protein HUJ06_006245 [Nelumbo nucifera]
MVTLPLNPYHALPSLSLSSKLNWNSTCPQNLKAFKRLCCNRGKIKAVGTGTISGSESAEQVTATEESPSIDFAFVSPVLLPDGTPDIHLRSACGGQKLRDIMLDNNIDLYGPSARPLLNCGGGGTCGTCLVEVVEGKELLSPRTDKEKEILRKKPKNWRLACQTIVGNGNSKGQVVIQQLPEWKAHEWV